MQKFQIGSMQRVPLMISSILQHAAVELQPGEFTVDEAFGA